MANTHALFQNYNQKIKISSDKRSILFVVRDSLRARMKSNFLLIPAETRMQLELYFQTQGSVIMDTIINPLDDDFDLDDGVYFKGNVADESRPAPDVFHQWVIQAVDKDNEYETITDKPTCVRVKYKQGFHIDIPIYFAGNYECPDLAHTKENWIMSNPVEFIEWFEQIANSGFQKAFLYDSSTFAEPYVKWLSDIRKQDCQIRRVVRYVKAWADKDKKDMPCGIVMTILVANNLAVNERDDIAFRDTLVNIKKYFDSNGVQCPRPTSPVGEDLLAKTSAEDKAHFIKMLESLIDTGNKAINSVSERQASILWNKALGTRFPVVPEPLKPQDSTPQYEAQIEALRRTASQSRPWSPKK